jgi:OmpA-OmpF porin, OOP family
MNSLYWVVCFGLGASLLHAQEPDAWDFVPGEKMLLYDDYTDMPRGAAPPHWKARGAAMRLVDGRLTAATGESTLWPNITKWPSNFTIEMDVDLKKATNPDIPPRNFDWTFLVGEDTWTMHIGFGLNAEGGCEMLMEIADPGENQRSPCKVQADKPNKFAIWCQDGRLRAYVNGERILDMNQVKFKFDKVNLRIGPSEVPFALGPVRIAESMPDFSKSFFASGRYVTHGILFDVNSDKIKAESKPVLKQIAEALAARTAVKLRIEGHTDSSGDAAKNLELSKSRAESVKAALVGLGVAADRLATEGFGDTKPVAQNDTPQGKAENRRVEFLKL